MTKLGATGKFPQGKLNEHDEGELRLAIVSKDNFVVIDFGTPVVWLGLTKKEAETIGNAILAKAKEL